MTFDSWPVWKRALTLNVLGLAGVAIGFASSDVKLSPEFVCRLRCSLSRY